MANAESYRESPLLVKATKRRLRGHHLGHAKKIVFHSSVMHPGKKKKKKNREQTKKTPRVLVLDPKLQVQPWPRARL